MHTVVDAALNQDEWSLFFGPQHAGLSAPDLRSVRSSLLQYPDLEPLRDAIGEFDTLYHDLAAHIPHVSDEIGVMAATQLSSWLKHDQALNLDYPYVNSLRTTMTVIAQLCQVRDFCHCNDFGVDYQTLLHKASHFGVQGHCIGLLSAMAVLSAKDIGDLGTWAAVAVRIAFCVGLCVDAQTKVEDFSSFAVRAQSGELSTLIAQIKEKLPKSYASVIIDQKTFTLTVPSSQKADFARFAASTPAMCFDALGLQGRFHHSSNRLISSQLRDFCTQNASVQFLDPKLGSNLAQPILNGEALRKDLPLGDSAIQAILETQSDWRSTLLKTFGDLQRQPTLTLSVGPAHSISSSFARSMGISVQRIEDHLRSIDGAPVPTEHERCCEGAVAVISMGCRFPGADSVEQFWEIIEAGASMARQVPKSRFGPDHYYRPQTKGYRYIGNFLEHQDQFDHKFFGKSSREAQQMDPQQRILLEVAYQTIQDAGWLSTMRPTSSNVGCFIGTASGDYHDNISQHQPSAYSTLGSIRGSLCGRISHFFNWIGPSMNIDTACSSSTVAIHQACRAIIAKDCTAALAGGVHVITSPYLFQNLIAGSFTTQTGASRAFDIQADGYCRGEGVGLVLLKDLKQAISDGDFIHGIIDSSAINQGYNDTAINKPNQKSQVELLEQLLRDANMKPDDVSYVEAHGTGTQVGDPIEASTIETVFGGRQNRPKLHVGAVKSNVGHSEGASGVAGLIKILMMIRHRIIPLQANFDVLNPKVRWNADDGIGIPKQNMSWADSRLVACLNNYGAAGSNAALLVSNHHAVIRRTSGLSQYPIIVNGNSVESAIATVDHMRSDISPGTDLCDLSYNLLIRRNSRIPVILAFCADSSENLRATLSDDSLKKHIHTVETPRPVVLAFAGQGHGKMSLSRELYEGCDVLRNHILRCDRELQELGLSSMTEAILDIYMQRSLVQEHLAIVIIQYATARMWLDCGLRASSMIGHSFGQLTALAISGIMAVSDCLRLVATRAQLIESRVQAGAGIMISVAASATALESVLKDFAGIDSPPEVACYNGPESTVLAGDRQVIAAVAARLNNDGIRTTHLPVNYAFHSRDLDCILPELQIVADDVSYKEPDLPIMFCTEEQTATLIDGSFIVHHTRHPVYFHAAVQRLHESLGSCTWLGMGPTNHTAGMIRRALDSPSEDLFVGASLDGSVAVAELNQAFLALAKDAGPPSHQSSPTRHKICEANGIQNGYSTISVDHTDPGFRALVEGHAVLGSPLCPASVYLDLVADAAMQEARTNSDAEICLMAASWRSLSIHAPLGLDPSLQISLHLKRESFTTSYRTWSFTVTSCFATRDSSDTTTEHASGFFVLSTQIPTSIASYGRLLSLEAALAIFDTSSIDAVSGKPIYSLMNRVVHYSDYYKSVQKIASSGALTAAIIHIPIACSEDGQSIDYFSRLLEAILQVAGIYVNCFSNDSQDSVFIANSIEAVELSCPIKSISEGGQDRRYIVCAKSVETPTKTNTSDIVVYERDSTSPIMAISGVCFHKVKTSVLRKRLARASGNSDSFADADSRLQEQRPVVVEASGSEQSSELVTPGIDTPASTIQHESSFSKTVVDKMIELVSVIAGISIQALSDKTKLADAGLDSMSTIELASDIKSSFGVQISSASIGSADTIHDLCHLVSSDNGHHGFMYKGGTDATTESDEKLQRPHSKAQPGPANTGTNRPKSVHHHGSHRSFSPANPAVVQMSNSKVASSSLVQGNPTEYENAFFAFPGGHGTAATYSSLPTLGDGMTIFGLNSPFWKDDIPYTASFCELARLYIAEIKRVKPQGPYILGGYSFGGVLAYEAARQMIEAGDQVDHLVMIDSACPLEIPGFPPPLLEFFDTVDIYHDTVDKRGDQPISKSSKDRMQHPHIVGNIAALAGYNPTPIPLDKVPQTMLFAASDGIDPRGTLPRPKVSKIDEKVVEWTLDDRADVDNHAFGWHQLLGRDKLRVIMTSGNHFSIMKEPHISKLAGKLRDREWMEAL